MTAKEGKSIKLGESLSLYTNQEFINKEGKIIKPDELSFLGAGENSSVWKYENENITNAFKIFFEGCTSFSLQSSCYERLKKVKLQRIVNVIDGFYKNDINMQKALDAYLMTYLEEDREISILDIPTSYLFYNVQLLENDIKLLSENKIVMNDIKTENSIINSKYELFFSDIDMYTVAYSLSEKEVLKNNKIELLYFFKRYLAQELENLEMAEILTSEEHNKAIEEVLETFMLQKSNIETYNCLEKLFSGYDTPKEYFLSMRK